ncbi:MAG: hypothetical protein U0996_25060 [Planctomycetaceae bacterium]
MSFYRTGDAGESSSIQQVSAYEDSPRSPFTAASITQDRIEVHSSGARVHRGQVTNPATLAISPSIRKELRTSVAALENASHLMESAHAGQGVDVVELSLAVEAYRQAVEILWRYRDVGLESWRSVIAFTRQALLENSRDEEFTISQCHGLRRLVSFLSNRMLTKDDLSEAMSLLASSGFDTLLFFSQPS